MLLIFFLATASHGRGGANVKSNGIGRGGGSYSGVLRFLGLSQSLDSLQEPTFVDRFDEIYERRVEFHLKDDLRPYVRFSERMPKTLAQYQQEFLNSGLMGLNRLRKIITREGELTDFAGEKLRITSATLDEAEKHLRLITSENSPLFSINNGLKDETTGKVLTAVNFSAEGRVEVNALEWDYVGYLFRDFVAEEILQMIVVHELLSLKPFEVEWSNYYPVSSRLCKRTFERIKIDGSTNLIYNLNRNRWLQIDENLRLHEFIVAYNLIPFPFSDNSIFVHEYFTTPYSRDEILSRLEDFYRQRKYPEMPWQQLKANLAEKRELRVICEYWTPSCLSGAILEVRLNWQDPVLLYMNMQAQWLAGKYKLTCTVGEADYSIWRETWQSEIRCSTQGNLKLIATIKANWEKITTLAKVNRRDAKEILSWAQSDNVKLEWQP